MTRVESDIAAEATGLPLVSVVVVNYNHAALLPEAVQSVLAQTYPAVECLIVDDASTDESVEIAAALAQRHPQVSLLRRPQNAGAMRACLDGFAATRGTFVHFLDADDLVFPNFLETHVAAHLSLRLPVGFTSSDVIVSSGGSAVTCCDGNISRYRYSPDCKVADRRALPPHLAGIETSVEVLKVDPWFEGWPWTATSAMVYRRAALDLIAGVVGNEHNRNSTDTFFCQGINTITGSAIIDAPLAVYRIHGTNDFFRTTPLDHRISFDKPKWRAKQIATIDALLAHVIARRHELAAGFWDSVTLLEVLKRLCALHPDRPSPVRLVERHAAALAEAVGREPLRAWIKTVEWVP